MTDINDIASQHLGKAGDGSVVKPYVTPDHIDASLLVGVPRYLNREQYLIDETDLPFVGFDVWNAYEVSFLLDNGYPVSGVVKLRYNSGSSHIVESKSIKLYLNSFNMEKMGPNVDQAIVAAEERIGSDLKECVGTDDLALTFFWDEVDAPEAIDGYFDRIEDVVDVTELEFDAYNEDPSILQYTAYDPQWGDFAVYSNALRSNCRVTNQPDWGDVFIAINGTKVPTEESLLKYIVSMRRENHFHEEICECIYKRLYDALPGARILVACLYTRRGGIDINPVRATDEAMLNKYVSSMYNTDVPHQKTGRQ